MKILCQKQIHITPMVSTYCMQERGHQGPCEDQSLGIIIYRCDAFIKGQQFPCGLPEGHTGAHRVVMAKQCESKGPRGQRCGKAKGHIGKHQHSEADRVHWD